MRAVMFLILISIPSFIQAQQQVCENGVCQVVWNETVDAAPMAYVSTPVQSVPAYPTVTLDSAFVAASPNVALVSYSPSHRYGLRSQRVKFPKLRRLFQRFRWRR
jgi:hypothetical protein